MQDVLRHNLVDNNTFLQAYELTLKAVHQQNHCLRKKVLIDVIISCVYDFN